MFHLHRKACVSNILTILKIWYEWYITFTVCKITINWEPKFWRKLSWYIISCNDMYGMKLHHPHHVVLDIWNLKWNKFLEDFATLNFYIYFQWNQIAYLDIIQKRKNEHLRLSMQAWNVKTLIFVFPSKDETKRFCVRKPPEAFDIRSVSLKPILFLSE